MNRKVAKFDLDDLNWKTFMYNQWSLQRVHDLLKGVPMTFQGLLGRIRSGDDEALNVLLSECRGQLRKKAQDSVQRSSRARYDTSDLLQESLLKISQDVFAFRGTNHGEWQSWLRAVLQARAAAMHRHHHAERRSVDIERVTSDDAQAVHSPDPLEDAIRREDREYVAAHLEDLPEHVRDVVKRRIVDRQSFQEIATATGCSPGSARVAWSRAVKRLAQCAKRDFS